MSLSEGATHDEAHRLVVAGLEVIDLERTLVAGMVRDGHKPLTSIESSADISIELATFAGSGTLPIVRVRSSDPRIPDPRTLSRRLGTVRWWESPGCEQGTRYSKFLSHGRTWFTETHSETEGHQVEVYSRAMRLRPRSIEELVDVGAWVRRAVVEQLGAPASALFAHDADSPPATMKTLHFRRSRRRLVTETDRLFATAMRNAPPGLREAVLRASEIDAGPEPSTTSDSADDELPF
jgi:hypothetical protein